MVAKDEEQSYTQQKLRSLENRARVGIPLQHHIRAAEGIVLLALGLAKRGGEQIRHLIWRGAHVGKLATARVCRSFGSNPDTIIRRYLDYLAS